MRISLVAGNWKMHMATREAVNLVNRIEAGLRKLRDIEVVICPPFTALYQVGQQLEKSNIALGAQNMHHDTEGAFTGEISPLMLKDLGCRYVILGHSERRALFREKDEFINKKVKTALKYNITPIVCIGETLEQRERNETLQVVNRQIEGSLKDLTEQDWKKIVMAYEPVWAIGTGKTATPEQAEEVHACIRKQIAQKSKEAAEEIRVLYGGSVKPDNMAQLMAKPNIDGALVGGASLKADAFIEIIECSLQKKEASGVKS